jgi:hypothetical protein
MTNEIEEKAKEALEAGQVTCFISKKKVPAADTVEVERNGRRVLVHKRFAPKEETAEA